MSTQVIAIRLSTGNKAVYEVMPQHVPREGVLESRQWPQNYGVQLAHELNGKWYKPGGWKEITDQETIDLLNSYKVS